MTVIDMSSRGARPLDVGTHALWCWQRNARRAADAGDAATLQFAVETLQIIESHGRSARIRRSAANAVRDLLPRLRGTVFDAPLTDGDLPQPPHLPTGGAA